MHANLIVARDTYIKIKEQGFHFRSHVHEFNKLVEDIGLLIKNHQPDMTKASNEIINIIQEAFLKEARNYGKLDEFVNKMTTPSKGYEYPRQLWNLLQFAYKEFEDYENRIDLEKPVEKNIFLKDLYSLDNYKATKINHYSHIAEHYKFHINSLAHDDLIGKTIATLDYCNALKELDKRQSNSSLQFNLVVLKNINHLFKGIYTTILKQAGKNPDMNSLLVKIKGLKDENAIYQMILNEANKNPHSKLASVFSIAFQYATQDSNELLTMPHLINYAITLAKKSRSVLSRSFAMFKPHGKNQIIQDLTKCLNTLQDKTKLEIHR